LVFSGIKNYKKIVKLKKGLKWWTGIIYL
jgi:hypothetical protein